MAAYTMKSDKIFLRCFDIGSVEVYELDSPYIFPVKGKHWSRVGISVGPGNKYEALKIGENEVKGDVLEVLSQDLFHSRLLVNREGLCFLSTAGVTTPFLEVEYYRLFDLYNWSKLCVQASLNTRWARSDFVDGCPLDIVPATGGCNIGDDKGSGDAVADVDNDEQCKEKLREKEKELEEERRKHEREIKEVKRVMEEELAKKQEKIDELAEADSKNQKELQEKKDEITKSNQKHKTELEQKQKKIDRLNREVAEAGNKNQKELKEIAELKKELAGERNKIVHLENELIIYVFKGSGLTVNEFYRRMVVHMQTNLLPSKIRFKYEQDYTPRDASTLGYGNPRPSDVSTLGLPFQSVSGISFANRIIRCGVPLSHNDFDLDNWRVLMYLEAYGHHLDANSINTVAYYDGNRYQVQVDGWDTTSSNSVSIPCPCPPANLCKYDISVQSIPGVGPRVIISFTH